MQLNISESLHIVSKSTDPIFTKLPINQSLTFVCTMAQMAELKRPSVVVDTSTGVQLCYACRYSTSKIAMVRHLRSALHAEHMMRWNALTAKEQRCLILDDIARSARSFEEVQREALWKENAWVAACKVAGIVGRERVRISHEVYGVPIALPVTQRNKAQQRYSGARRHKRKVRPLPADPARQRLRHDVLAIILADPSKAVPQSDDELRSLAQHMLNIASAAEMPCLNALSDALPKRQTKPPPLVSADRLQDVCEDEDKKRR